MIIITYPVRSVTVHDIDVCIHAYCQLCSIILETQFNQLLDCIYNTASVDHCLLRYQNVPITQKYLCTLVALKLQRAIYWPTSGSEIILQIAQQWCIMYIDQIDPKDYLSISQCFNEKSNLKSRDIGCST